MSDLVVSGIESVVPTTTTTALGAGTLIELCKRHLYTGSREAMNKLASDITAAATTVTFTYPLGGIGPGAKISVDLEDMYIWTAAGTSATVERGRFASSPAAHTAGAIVTVNPKFSDAEIFRALNDEIAGLSAEGLFRMRTVTVPYVASTYGYDLTSVSDLLDVYDVAWKSITGQDWHPVEHWDVRRDMPTSQFASGKALFVRGGVQTGRDMLITYEAPFATLTDLSGDVLTVTGLPSTALDILPMGAAIRLTAGREIRRNFNETQGDTRRAEEVPAGANLNAPAALRQLRQQRIAQEYARLRRQYPLRRRRFRSA